MKKPLISVIVPVYNAEEYLERCVKSILNQTFDDFELLLVNDGSKDGSLQLCNDFASRDSRVRVLDKPNGGVSSARNLALDKAEGEWVMFVDADDWVELNMLELCVPYVDTTDLVYMGWVAHRSDGRVQPRKVSDVGTPDDLLKELIRRRTKLAIWSTLIRRSIFEEHNIRFDASYNYAEDWLTLLRTVCYAKRIKTIPISYVYHYNLLNESNCTNNMTIQKLACNVRLCKDIRPALGGRHTGSLRDTHLMIIRELVEKYGYEATCDHLLSIRDKVDFYSLWDLIVANFSWKKKRLLYDFWRYSRKRGLRK